MTIEFKFSLKDKVLIKEIQRPGNIELIQFSALGIEYRVCYWDNGDRKQVWVYEDDLEAR